MVYMKTDDEKNWHYPLFFLNVHKIVSEWGGPCPLVGARKTLGLNSAGQLGLRDRMVEVRAGATC